MLLALQITLGALTVLSHKQYIINSLHVVTGALGAGDIARADAARAPRRDLTRLAGSSRARRVRPMRRGPCGSREASA